jgi:Raf kinase inhibitor-like YbhB/YbcL family protein
MKHVIAACAVILPAASAFAAPAFAADAPAPPPGIILSSASFTDGGVIPDKYTQASPAPVSPELHWVNTPAGTQSFTLILHDPDAAPQRKSDDVLHWMMFNIPGTATALPEGIDASTERPDGSVQAKNIGGKVGFMGPGSRNVYHHYTFELYALDIKLALGPDATRADVLKAMDGHILGKGVVEGRFHR